MKSNKLLLSALAITTVAYASAQTPAKGVKWNENVPSQVQIVELNPENQLSENVLETIQLSGNRTYVQNTLHHDEENDLLYFFTDFNNNSPQLPTVRQQMMVVVQASTGEKLRELPFMNTTVMAPFIISEKNELGFISSNREFKGYGNNDDDISLVLFNLTTGEITSKIELPTLSFQAMNAPFVGKMKNTTGQVGQNEDISLSSPCYISSLEKLVFVAKDVVGTNRLFKVNTRTGKLESQLKITYDVLDMVYDENKNVLRTLYVENNMIMLGDLNLKTNQMDASLELRALNANEDAVADGYVAFDQTSGNIFVAKSNDGAQEFFTVNSELELLNKETRNNAAEKVNFDFPATYNPSYYQNLATAVKMYPNPSNGQVTVETNGMTTVTNIRVMNSVGEVMKNVEVQSGEMFNDINVSNLATGMYFVEIESDGAETVNKKLIVR